MGMESFFIKVIPQELNKEIRGNFLYIIGEDKTFNFKLKELLNITNLNIEKDISQENHFVLHNCMDIYICENDKESTYIDLIGSFSCFELAIKEMNKFLYYLKNIVKEEIFFIIAGDKLIFEDFNFQDVIKKYYYDKYKSFKEIYSKADFIAPPSKFYKEYYGIIPRLKRKIKSILWSRGGQRDGGIDHPK